MCHLPPSINGTANDGGFYWCWSITAPLVAETLSFVPATAAGVIKMSQNGGSKENSVVVETTALAGMGAGRVNKLHTSASGSVPHQRIFDESSRSTNQVSTKNMFNRVIVALRPALHDQLSIQDWGFP